MTDHDHDHTRTVAPTVDEITDFEVLEIALRELCIEKGIFTAEDHRRFTEFAGPRFLERPVLITPDLAFALHAAVVSAVADLDDRAVACPGVTVRGRGTGQGWPRTAEPEMVPRQ
jgi:hypothetical protein